MTPLFDAAVDQLLELYRTGHDRRAEIAAVIARDEQQIRVIIDALVAAEAHGAWRAENF